MELKLLLLIGVSISVYALVAGRARTSPITPPMVFVALGIIVGPAALGLVQAPMGQGALHLLAELTLATILFTDASRIDVSGLWNDHDIPIRMLAIALPISIVAGAGVALLVFGEFSWLQALLIGAVLAPTDAALGQAVMSNESVPIRVRQSLNVEAGLNDGLAYPAVFIVLAVLAGESSALLTWETAGVFASQIGLGIVVGVLLGGGGGWLLERMHQRGWTQDAFLRLSGLGLILASLGTAGLVGGNGFIAAFVGGLSFGWIADEVHEAVHRFGETEGNLLGLLTFLALGMIVVPEALAHFDWRVVLYAVLSLTVVRMLPIALSLLGLGLRPGSIAFLGWFGPRGVASVVFLMLVSEHAALEHRGLIMCIGVATILGSIFLHGATASTLSRIYGARCNALADQGKAEPEHREVGALPYRHSHRPGDDQQTPRSC